MKELVTFLQHLTFVNLDLLSVGITIAAIALLGFIVYVSNPKSVTNISFLIFCAVTLLWSFFNYISYQTTDSSILLPFWRMVIFLGFWHSFSFFSFLYVFPQEKIIFPKWYTYFLFPYIIFFSLWTLFGNLVFSGIHLVKNLPEPIVEKGIIIFIVTACLLIISSFYFLIKRIIKAKKHQKEPYVLILIGALSTFALLLTFNLILPGVFGIIRFIPLGALTILPFAGFTAYAIFKHKTFKVRNLGSALMAFLICTSTFVEIVFAENYGQLILRSGVFLFVLLISIQFVKNIFMLEHITESLEDANDKLKSLDKLKSEFISLVSHQLRSPLTVIKGYASTLSDGVVGELTEKQKEIVRHIYVSSTGLASVVEDFLSVTKIEQGGMKYVFTPTDIRQIVLDLASDMKMPASMRHLEFLSDVDIEGNFVIEADGTKLKQVFLNLIDNSIKYTKEGFVKISLKREYGDNGIPIVRFSVSDSGVGISEEMKPKLFQKFGRGQGAILDGGGSGLGLYLAYEITKAHRGKITVDSEGLGKGSTFSVILTVV
jgi:signal transduction histidine kinase